jgi:hypothetical protein
MGDELVVAALPPAGQVPTEAPIDLNPQVQPDTIDLNATPHELIPDEKVAGTRAIKAHIAQGEASPGPDQLRAEIMSGQETAMRDRMAVAKDGALRQIRLDVVKNVAAEKAKKGQSLTEDDVRFIAGLSQEQLGSNPATILETEYARQYFNQQAGIKGGDNVITEGLARDPEGTSLEVDIASNIKSRQEMVKTQLETAQRKWDQTSWGSAIASHAARFIPLLENYRLHSSKEDSILPGTNLADRVQRLWAMPPERFHAQFTKDFAELEAQNPLTAMKFGQAVLSFSLSDEFLDNVFGLLDVTSIPAISAGKVLVKGAKALARGAEKRATIPHGGGTTTVTGSDDTIQQVKQALKDGVKADGAPNFKPAETILAEMGDVKAASHVAGYKNAVKTLNGQDPLSESGSLRQQIPSLFNIDNVLEGAKDLGYNAVHRFRTTLEANAADLITAVSNPSKIIRLEEGGDALKTAISLTEQRLRSVYPHLNDAVLNFGHTRAEDVITNVHQVQMNLGKRASKPEGERLFRGKLTAQQVENVIKQSEHQVARMKATVADPIEAKRNPQYVKDLKETITQTEAGIAERKAWLNAKPSAEVNLGTPESTLFDSAKQANYWARDIYKLNPEAYTIHQQGSGFHISVRMGVSEIEDATRDLLISTRHVTPTGVANTFLGRLRTPEDTLSVANRENRHTATHGAQELNRLAKGAADQIGTLPNKSIKRLDRFLAVQRDTEYMERDVLRRGVFNQNVGEFDTAWTAMHKQPPTEQERIAYFTYVQLNDWDYMFRNVGLVRDKARQGIEEYQFIHKVLDETTGESAMVKSPFIEGKIVDDIPWTDVDDARIWVYDGKAHSKQAFMKNGANGAERADVENKIKQGYKVVQIANPVGKDLRKIAESDEVVHFMVVADVDRRPLSWQQLEYRPGGHVEYTHDHWVKQPVVRRAEDGRHVYEGDQAIFNQATEAEAKKFATAMDTARVMLKDGNPALKSYLSENLPYTVRQFQELFAEKIAADGTKVPARLHIEDPIRHTTSSRNLLDAHPDLEKGYTNFENGVRSPYNLYGQIDKKFTNERDLTLGTVRERMNGTQPIFKLEPSKLVDPLSTMNRAMANIIRSRYLNDYKTQSVETFIQEFGDLMKVEGGLAEIRKNPVYYLHNAVFETQPGSPLQNARLAAAQNAQRAVLNLLGTNSELGRNLRWVQEDLLNFIYNKGGQKTSDYVAEHLLPVVQDPFRYARGVAFHAKLGLFNPVQLFLQAQTLTHVAAVSGMDNGLRGISAATLMRRLSLTEDAKVIDHFGNMAAKLGWKKEHFIESYTALKKTGLWNVEGEVAMKDDFFDPKLFKGAVGSFLDKGTFFFREGERLVRLTSWNAAYREWRVANPEAILDQKALSGILNRQNTLSVNMTRASAAWWQQGVMSIPTQFFSYQARLAEQFLGKRLTPAEKARAFTVYSGMYGVPTAVGAVTFAYPWYEDVRQAALERGIDVNSPGMRALVEGIPSTMIQMTTGNEQNFAQRYGPGGLHFFKDVFQHGKAHEIFGAAPNIIMDMTKAVAPTMKAVLSPFVPGMGDWKMTSADAITALQEISTINNVGKAIYAFNTGQYISKNEINLGPASTADALMTAMLGTQPLRNTDAFILAESMKEQKSMQDAVKKEVIKNFRRALREFDQGNDGAAEKYLNNVKLQMIGAKFRPDEQSKIVSEAIDGHESFVDKMNRQHFERAPADQYWQRVYRVFKVKPNEE